MRSVANIFYLNIPSLGMEIKSIRESPRIEYGGFVFLGTYLTEKCKTTLIDIKWQNLKTGELISNNEFINRFFIC